MSYKETLTEKHAYWKGFVTRLRAEIYLFDDNDENLFTYCSSLGITRKILISLPNIDVDGSIEYLISQGGESDWDVLVDVARIG